MGLKRCWEVAQGIIFKQLIWIIENIISQKSKLNISNYETQLCEPIYSSPCLFF